MSFPVETKTVRVTVTGLVQGVGFRPFVYRIANQYGLSGWVENTNENVRIRVTGRQSEIDRFLQSLKNDPPQASRIEKILVEEGATEFFRSFTILNSHDVSDNITEISPDIAVCHECLADMEQPGTRQDYPFVNCTHCGPRFTIIRSLPYDRSCTTMEPFPMCPGCREEYDDVHDRRFHAQPTACSACGPGYELYWNGESITNDINTIADRVAGCLDSAGILLLKGLGGMHLACDAFSDTAVEKLRNVKKRDGKPFALLFRDLETVRRYAHVSTVEEEALLSWRRPIVLLEMKGKRIEEMQLPGHEPELSLADGINSGLSSVGVMLPYMPFHFLLFKKLKTNVIVLTSGNFSNEPILIDNKEALAQFTPFTDAIVIHNRDIYNRTDDSVVRVMAGKERLIRRSRGFVPAPVRTGLNTDGIIALGAELTNCFCIGKGSNAILSQHIGDLQGIDNLFFYESTIEQFLQLFRAKPALIATDMHPEYNSVRSYRLFGETPKISIQHHHAHIASCMAEHHLDEKVIGVALDGTGYGDDGHTWGAEFMVCDLLGYSRINHFEYISLPGGDLAAEEPWRMAVAYLYKVFGNDLFHLELPFLKIIGTDKIAFVIHMIDRKVNCPQASSAGRLFDAVASILGLCQVSTYQAEGPMRLESLVQQGIADKYSYAISDKVTFDGTIRGIAGDILDGVPAPVIAARFHNTIISVIADLANQARVDENIDKVVLSGGVFQNKYLLENTIRILEKEHFKVYSHEVVPANDGGIALGQLAIASKRRELPCV